MHLEHVIIMLVPLGVYKLTGYRQTANLCAVLYVPSWYRYRVVLVF
jgi:hypothetical protein